MPLLGYADIGLNYGNVHLYPKAECLPSKNRSIALVRPKPGTRKKGVSALASPSAAVTELMPPSTSRSTRRIDRLEGAWMVLAVSADGMAFVVDAPDDGRIGTRHLADQEIGGLHALRRQRLENDAGIGRQWAVVEGNHHLVVLQRQRLLVLHGAEQGKFAGIDGQHPAGAEGVWIAGARLRAGRDGPPGQNANTQSNDETHRASLNYLAHISQVPHGVRWTLVQHRRFAGKVKRARSRAICRYSGPPSSRLLSISRPQRRSALPFRTVCSSAPTK